MENTFEELVQEIEFCYASHQNEKILDVLKNNVTMDSMPSLISEFLANEIVLHYISIHSYTHQNGFDKVLLYESPKQGWKLRLHIWWDEMHEAKINYDVHNHAWNYFSYIVTGGISNNIYKLNANSNTSYHKYSYSIDNQTLKSELNYEGIEKLSLLQSDTFLKGDAYSLQHNLLHQVLPTSDVCATLVIHDKPFKQNTDVYKSEKASIITSIGNNRQLDLNETKYRLIKLRGIL